MKAVFIEQTGPVSNLQYGDLPTPTPGDNQILVQVEAVAVNPIDTYIRSGLIAMNLPKPFIPGCDLAGTVHEVGANVTQYRPGDRVWGSNQGLLGRQGTFSEFACVDEHWLYPLPQSVSFKDAAAVSLVGITAHLGLVHHAHLQAQETLFVNGGSGGVGTMVLQMANALGARSGASAGSQTKLETCRHFGAEFALDYHANNFNEALQEWAPKGINVWWETSREPDFEKIVPLLAPEGRIILMAGREARPAFPVGPFYVKGCSLHGFAMFNAPPERQRAAAQDINRWMAQGKLKPHIGRLLPLSQTAEAHQLQEDNTLKKQGTLNGKIILTPTGH